MRRNLCFLLLAGFVISAAALWADSKITKKTDMGPMTMGETVYIKGSRMRTETENPMGPGSTSIMQCDKKQIIEISNQCKTYYIMPLDDGTNAPPPSPPSKSTGGATRKGGIVTITTTIKDTGETKQMFGYTAHHVHTTMSMQSSPDACNPNNMTMESDGWYANVGGAGFSCPMRPRVPPARGGGGGCMDQYRFKAVGTNPGQPLELTTTVQGFTMKQETTDLSHATLDPALFDVPAGYTQVSDASGLQCGGGGRRTYPPNVVPPNVVTPPVTTDGEGSFRRRGHVRVGVVTPESHVNKEYEAQMWRDKLVEDIVQMQIDAVPIDATDRKGIQEEAAQKKCDYILYTDVNEVNAPSAGRKIFGRATGGSTGNYSTKTHLTLMPLNQTEPRLEADAQGQNSGDLNDAGLDAMQSEAGQVVEELHKPWPRK